MTIYGNTLDNATRKNNKIQENSSEAQLA